MIRQFQTDTADRAALLRRAKRIVVKLGSAVVCDQNQMFNQEHLNALVSDAAALMKSGRQLVLVSSGAIALGASELGIHRSRLRDPSVTRACAAIGQCKLMEAYARAFRPHNLTVAQVLVTEDDFSDLNRYKILRQTFEKLLKMGSVPVVNENDTVTNIYTEQPAVFRDNDRLAALVLSKLDADALILLSNVDGLLRDTAQGPTRDNVVPLVREITPQIRESASGKSSVGRGGMIAKLDAAEIGMRAGSLVVIANGKKPTILTRIFSGESEGTVFQPGKRIPGKRRWVAFATTIKGTVSINANAVRAVLGSGNSLLISGVCTCQGEWSAGHVIRVVGPEGTPVGRGIAECSSVDLTRSLEAPAKRGVLVRRENLFLTPAEEVANLGED